MSSEPETDEDTDLLALRDLLRHRGFEMQWAHAKQEYGPEAYGRKLQAAFAAIPPGPDRAYQMEKVTDEIGAMFKAVNELMEWPLQEVKRRAPERQSKRPFDALRRISR